ncbi:MAG: ParB/RepB/Spo0J family partition protein [Candidatus Bathyarchaeia archaeon]
MKGKTQVLTIEDLSFNAEFYPRFKTSWLTVYQYAMAMKSGSVFPDVVVGVLNGKMYVVDGWHRIEALKLLGEKYVRAIVKTYNSEAELFADAVRLNAAHGRQLSVQEKARIIDKLKTYNFTLEQISEIIRVPVDKIERFTVKVVTLPNGTKIYMKSIVEQITREKPEIAAEIKQELFNVRNIQTLLTQLKDVLESGVFPIHDEKVKALAVEVYGLLGEILQLKTLSL